MGQNLLILGASARAAAWSACRAGFRITAVDLFADVDLRAVCRAWQVRKYPDDLEFAAREAPFGPWMYTGGLENYPALVDRIASVRPLWGNPGRTLRAVRDPLQIAEALTADGIRCPAIDTSYGGSLPDGTWLRKPLRSSGGKGIRLLTPGAVSEPIDGDAYLQQHIDGVACSAVFVAAAGRAILLGTTKQLVGVAWTGASRFAYAGSCGLLELDGRQQESWLKIGRCLSRRFKLRGLFGVDAIDAEETYWPVEVNPRYTASVEVLEQGLGIAAVALHAESCRMGRLPAAPSATIDRCHGKAIVYAERDVLIDEAFHTEFVSASCDTADWTVADIPDVGQRILRGRPIATVLVCGGDLGEVEAKLQTRAGQLRQMLKPPTVADPTSSMDVHVRQG